MRLLTDKSASTAPKAGSVSTVNNECGLNDYSSQLWGHLLCFLQRFLVQMLLFWEGLGAVMLFPGRKRGKQSNKSIDTIDLKKQNKKKIIIKVG